jgi:vacuolar-type H+-ATPase subunit F/Vma7
MYSIKIISLYIDKDLVFQEKKGNTANNPMKGDVNVSVLNIYKHAAKEIQERVYEKNKNVLILFLNISQIA